MAAHEPTGYTTEMRHSGERVTPFWIVRVPWMGRSHRLCALLAVAWMGSVAAPESLYDPGIVAYMDPNAEVRTVVSGLIVTLLGAGR